MPRSRTSDLMLQGKSCLDCPEICRPLSLVGQQPMRNSPSAMSFCHSGAGSLGTGSARLRHHFLCTIVHRTWPAITTSFPNFLQRQLPTSMIFWLSPPPHDAYDQHSAVIVRRASNAASSRLCKLFIPEERSDRRPSQLLDRMRQLFRTDPRRPTAAFFGSCLCCHSARTT